MVVDAASAPRVDGATIDYVDSAENRGFDLRLPAVTSANGGGPLADRVQRVLDERVNPSVAAHGGRITLMIREAVPEIEGIQDVTDHVSGAAPYYARET